MNIQFSSQPWDKKVHAFNYFDLQDKDPRKKDLDKYFIGKSRPVAESKPSKGVK